jgi:putative endonuclease
MPYHVYILLSEKDKNLYIGQTENLPMRLEAHYEGHVPSTKNRRPLKLVYSEQCETRSDAIKREHELKSPASRDFKRNLRSDSVG